MINTVEKSFAYFNQYTLTLDIFFVDMNKISRIFVNMYISMNV